LYAKNTKVERYTMRISIGRKLGCRERLAITSSFATILAAAASIAGFFQASLDWKLTIGQSGREPISTQSAGYDAYLAASLARFESPLLPNTPLAPTAAVLAAATDTLMPTGASLPATETSRTDSTIALVAGTEAPGATPHPQAATEGPTMSPAPTALALDPASTPTLAAQAAPTITPLPPTNEEQADASQAEGAPVSENAPATVDAALAASVSAPADVAATTPTATAAATESLPTPTYVTTASPPTPTDVARSQQEIVSATIQQTISAPTLLKPEAGAKLTGKISFLWQWDGEPLPEGYAFDLLIWSEAEHQAHGGTNAHGVMAPGRSLETVVDLDYVEQITEQGEGVYYWTVVVVKQEPYERLGASGESRGFAYYRQEAPLESPTKSP
jgi:hypothetical protein